MKKQLSLSNDVNISNMAMGNWKTKKNSKINRQTKSKKANIYIAYPPPNGWIGGDPVLNGFRVKAGK